MDMLTHSGAPATTPNGIIARITANIEAELAAEERRCAAQGLRTIRVVNDASTYTEGAAQMVYISDGATKSMEAEFLTRRAHPIMDAADGETIRYKSQGQRVTMKRVGIFDVIAEVGMPGRRGDRIKLMIERAPALSDAAEAQAWFDTHPDPDSETVASIMCAYHDRPAVLRMIVERCSEVPLTL